MLDPDFTLSAGPTAASARTLAALGSPVTYHYDPVFLDAFRRTEAKVGQVFGTKNEIILMQGEAVLGLEAAARSLVRPGMHVLNLVSGVFGKGMGYWLKGFGAELHELEVPYNEAVDPGAVAGFLDQHPQVELLARERAPCPALARFPVWPRSHRPAAAPVRPGPVSAPGCRRPYPARQAPGCSPASRASPPPALQVSRSRLNLLSKVLASRP